MTTAKVRRKEAVGIRKSLGNAQKYILKKERQSRWVWNDMHKRCHDNQFRMLALLNEAEDELEVIVERLKNGIIHADIYGNGTISTAKLSALLERNDE